MKLFILLLISSSTMANTFSVRESSARFELKITTERLNYSSEQFTKEIAVNECNRALTKRLNAEMLSLIPKEQPGQGISYFVDEKKMTLSNAAASRALALDQKMLNFFLTEEKLCQK